MELKLAIQKYPDLYNSLILGAKSLEEANELLMYLVRNSEKTPIRNLEDIMSAFVWLDTDQGITFWSNFHEKVISTRLLILNDY